MQPSNSVHRESGKRVMKPSNSTKSMDVDQPKGIHFQEEMIMDILSRLPVCSLLRFKCVSKPWKALISDPYFRMNHLNNAKNDQNSQKLLISQLRLGKDDMFNFYRSSISSAQVVEDEEKLDYPSNCKPVISRLYCCCDGLVLLAVSDRVDEHLLLWNPSTRESIVLPLPESPWDDCVCGMGYDATSDDYKILAINLNASVIKVSIELLALKSGYWRKISTYPTDILRVVGFTRCGMDSLAFVNGAFHWIGCRGCVLSRDYTIVSLNVSNEVYGEIPPPKQMRNKFNTRFIEQGVSVLGGMLCFYSTQNNWVQGIFKLWVMKDYGVHESWTELLTIEDENLFYSAIPKYMFVDGELLLRCKNLEGHGPMHRTSKRPFGSWPQCITAKLGVVYTESLISPDLLS